MDECLASLYLRGECWTLYESVTGTMTGLGWPIMCGSYVDVCRRLVRFNDELLPYAPVGAYYWMGRTP